MYGLYICPDIDIAMYTLAGIANRAKGWGIHGDTFTVIRQIGNLGEEAWFQLGDRDLATCLLRTQQLKIGRTLTQVTAWLCKRFGVKQMIVPPTDHQVETHITMKGKEIHLQEFWVRYGGRVVVRGVKYVGARRAKVTRQARDAIMNADRIIICPGNPVTSILPILAVGDFRRLMEYSRRKVVALSPMIGQGSFSGPAPALLKATGVEPTSLGVAKLYSDLLGEIIIHKVDSDQTSRIEALGIACKAVDTEMKNNGDERRLAKFLVQH